MDTTSRNKTAEEELKTLFGKGIVPTLSEILDMIGKYNTEDTVQWKGKFTTIGRVIFNECIFGHLTSYDFINEPVTADVLKNIINENGSKTIEKILSVRDFKTIMEVAHDLGFGITDVMSPGISMNMLVNDDKTYNNKMEEIYNKYKNQIEIDKDPGAMQQFENEMIDFSKEYYKNNPMIDLYESGAGPRWDVDWKNMKISMGALPDPGTGDIAMVKNNLKTGMSNEEIMAAANLQIFGAFARANDSALGGYMVSRLVAAFQSLIADKADCATKDYLETIDENPQDLLYRYIYDNGKEVFITRDNVNKYLNKPIKKRSPAFCKSKNGVCSKCLGEQAFMLLDSDQINIGLFVQIIGATVLYAYMKATHDMGAKLFKINDLDDFIE